MLENLKKTIVESFFFTPNRNQSYHLERLFFEIIRREQTSIDEIITYLKNNVQINKYSGGSKFAALKEALLRKRFPLSYKNEKNAVKKTFLNKLPPPLLDNWQIKKEFKPLKVFVEKAVKDSFLAKNFQNKFPKIKVEELNLYSDYLKNNKFTISRLKEPVIFIIKENWDFIKPCPCTKYHLGCGYWILNLGFGCPFDCSYCFMQHYTNSPGILLPANIEDFFHQFDKFYKKLKKPIRIGTGEFCDSLALDNITEYSKKMVSYFRNKNVLFELKTKSASINNLLDIQSSPNIIISWSLSPNSIIESQEMGAASLVERLGAAKEIQSAGYGIGFHFDPIIHIDNWQCLYKEVIDKLYAYAKPPFAWISLGTLRSNRNLKKICETRFPQSNIFYGELFIGEDKKLRYPAFIRKKIYEHIIQIIRLYDQKTPIYLCMEDKQIWKDVKGLVPHSNVESALIDKKKIPKKRGTKTQQ